MGLTAGRERKMAGISDVDLTSSQSRHILYTQLINIFCICTCTTSGVVTALVVGEW